MNERVLLVSTIKKVDELCSCLQEVIVYTDMLLKDFSNTHPGKKIEVSIPRHNPVMVKFESLIVDFAERLVAVDKLTPLNPNVKKIWDKQIGKKGEESIIYRLNLIKTRAMAHCTIPELEALRRQSNTLIPDLLALKTAISLMKTS